MGCVELLDYLDAGATVFGDLVDIRAFDQAHADVGVAQVVGRAKLAVPILLEVQFVQNGVEQYALDLAEDQIGGLGIVSGAPMWLLALEPTIRVSTCCGNWLA